MRALAFALLCASAGCTVLYGDWRGGGDGGMDAGADARGDMTLSSSCPKTDADAILCENFEAPLPAALLESQFSLVEVDTTRAYVGASSLHIRPFENTQRVFGGVHAAFPAEDEVWSRAWFYLQGTQPAGTRMRLFWLSYFSLVQTDAGFSVIDIQPAIPEEIQLATEKLPAGGWHCLEWGAEPGRWILRLDGQQIAMKSSPVVSYDQLSHGLAFEDGVPANDVDLWMDELLVTRRPYGCGP